MPGKLTRFPGGNPRQGRKVPIKLGEVNKTRNGLEADKMNSSVAFTRVQRTELSTGCCGGGNARCNTTLRGNVVIFRYSVNNLMPERPFVSQVMS